MRLAGEVLPSVRPNIGVEITREPIGVIGIITPWNFPIAIPAWKIAPALCYGNTIVFKPAELVPGCSWAIVDILHRAGLPKGVLNLVMGKGSVVGQAMLDSPDLAGITFTGSTGTGKRVAAASIEHNRKFQLEMGGKNPMVVLDDADLTVAVEAAANSGFFSTGQRCTASSRLIVTEGIHDTFVAALTEKLKTLVVDDALKAGTHIGPVVDERQLATDTDYIAIGKQEGAKLAFGGETITRDNPGFYLQPTLFTEATNQMRISREEIFGPVASVIRVKDYDEALSVANDTPIRSVGRHRHDEPQARDAFQAQFGSRHGHGQPADSRCRFPCAVRRPQGFLLRLARAGQICGRVLHRGEDGLHAGVKTLRRREDISGPGKARSAPS